MTTYLTCCGRSKGGAPGANMQLQRGTATPMTGPAGVLTVGHDVDAGVTARMPACLRAAFVPAGSTVILDFFRTLY